MSKALLNKINNRFKLLIEQANDGSWKDPFDPDYDRQQAENALFVTMGPMTDGPFWIKDWTDPSGFTHKKDTPAPIWTQDQTFMAIAGDPSKPASDPKSPQYGTETDTGHKINGAPLWRWATEQARKYNRFNYHDVMDAYSNGALMIMTMMRKGADESRVNIISWMKRNVLGSMEKGVGITNAALRVVGHRSQSVHGLAAVLGEKDPKKVREYANQIKGDYRYEKSNDKHEDNPFEQFSSRYYDVTTKYADALESEDDENIKSVRDEIANFLSDVKDARSTTRGFETGQSEAISDLSRGTNKTFGSIGSLDVETGDDGGTEAGQIKAKSDDDESSDITAPATITELINYTLRNDVSEDIPSDSPIRDQLKDYATTSVDDDIPGFHKGLSKKDPASIIPSGTLTAMELRLILRTFGVDNFYGKGKLRDTVDPRGAPGWWEVGEDPEIEPYIDEDGDEKIWNSVWRRNGSGAMVSEQGFNGKAVQDELVQETKEFNKLGIATTANIRPGTGRDEGRELTVSNVRLNGQQKSALIKFAGAAQLLRSEILGEGILALPILEGIDDFDKYALLEACDYVISMYNKVMLESHIRSIYKRAGQKCSREQSSILESHWRKA